MADRLLQTKLFIPPKRPFLIPRARLHQQLDGGRDGRVTLVAAPAGFGKTTLVTSWLAEQATPHAPHPTPHIAWLSLDEHDNDPGRFLAYLLAAIQTVCPTVGGLLPGDDEWQPRDLEAAMRELLNELAGEKRPFFLTLDDYHLITNPTIHDALAFFVDYLPPHIHLILTSRAEPPLPLPRWRVRGQLNDIRAEDLTFTAEEAAAFLRQTMGLDLADDTIAALEAQTEGWVAGLQLAALSLRGAKDPAALIANFTGRDRHITDYLLAEVLYQQPLEVQDFLLQTAVLERLTGALCDWLLEIGDWRLTDSPISNLQPLTSSHQLLHHLETHNLFLIPLDNERRWYRYHHLFGQLLRQRLRQEQGETAVRDLHRRAAQWHEQHGELETAVFHTLQAHDHDETARLIATLSPGNLWAPDSIGLLQQWGETVPAASLQRHPRAAILVASAHMISGNIPACLRFLQLLAGETAVLGETSLLRAIIARNEGDIAQAQTLIEQALAIISHHDQAMYWMAHMQLASCQQERGHLQQAEATIAAIVQQMRQQSATDLSIELQAVRFLAAMQATQGNLFQAQRQYEAGLRLAQSGSLSVATGLMHLGLGELSYQWNALDKAAAAFAEAHRWGRRTGMTDIMIGVYLGQMDLACQQRDVAELEALIEQLTAYVAPSQMPTIINMVATMVQLYRLRLWRVDGGEGLATAVRWANASGLKLTDEPTFAELLPYLTLAQTGWVESVATGDTQRLPELLGLFGRLTAVGQQANYASLTISGLTHQALILWQMGQRDAAMSHLVAALERAQPGSMVRVFLDCPVWLDEMWETAVSRHIHPYAPTIHRAHQHKNAPLLPRSPAPLLSLTDRETEILHAIAAGLSNSDIEQKLFISKNTVRTHIKNLYSKLAVSSRTAAVAKARELKLLDAAWFQPP